MTSVLIIEDSPEVRAAMERSLIEHGLTVDARDSAEAALEALEERSYDVLVTDLRMPGRSGLELLAEVYARDASIGTVLVSGFATARDSQRALELGVSQVLCKPFSVPELLKAIRKAAESETGFRGHLHGLSFVDILQMYHIGRRSILVSVSGDVAGEVHLEDGEVVHAKSADAMGERAFMRLIQATVGHIESAAYVPGGPRTIEKPFSALLLDSLRCWDEEGRDAAASRSSSDIPPDAAEALCGRLLEEVDECMAVLVAHSGSGEVIACAAADGFELDREAARRAVVSVCGNGQVRGPTAGGQAATGALSDVMLAAGDRCYLFSSIGLDEAVVVLAAGRSTSVAMAWRQIRAEVSSMVTGLGMSSAGGSPPGEKGVTSK